VGGSSSFGRDFLRLIGDAQQILAAQGSPAFLLLLGTLVDRAADTLLTGLPRPIREDDTYNRHRPPWRHDRKRRSRWRHRTVLASDREHAGPQAHDESDSEIPEMEHRTRDPANSAPRALPHNPSHDPHPEEERDDAPPPPPEQASRTPHPRCHRVRAPTLSNHTRTCNKLPGVYM
jgi:hypothetical protein